MTPMKPSLLVLILAVAGLPSARVDDAPTFCGKSADGWVDALRHGRREQRWQAVRILGLMGPAAGAAVPDLTELVRKGQFKDEAIEALVRIRSAPEVTIPPLMEQFRKQECQHLTGMGAIGFTTRVKDQLIQIGAPAVPALVEVLNGRDPDMRVCAAEVLGEIGPAAAPAVPDLIRALRPECVRFDAQDRHGGILRRHAIIALGRIGSRTPELLPILNALLSAQKESNYAETWELSEALGRLDDPPVAKLIEFFRRDEEYGTFHLSRLGRKARSAVPALREALTDRRLQKRIDAAVALAFVAPPAPEAVPVLVDALEHHPDENIGVREALGRIGPAARAAIPALIRERKQEEIGSDGLRALVRIDPEGRSCLPVLIDALADKDADVAYTAAEALSLLGPRAEVAAPALAAAMTRDFKEPFYDGGPQVAAAKALRRIGPRPKSTIPALIAALKYRHVVKIDNGPPAAGGFGGMVDETDFSAAEAAALVLGSFGPEAKSAVPALIEVVQAREEDDTSWMLRKAAIQALGQIGPDAQAAIPLLRKETETVPETDGTGLGIAAKIAVYRLDRNGQQLVEQWLKASTSPELYASLLGAMGKASPEGDALTRIDLKGLEWSLEGMDQEGESVLPFLEWRFERLARFGVGGRLAVPRLKELAKHENPWLRLWATEVLAKIIPTKNSNRS